MPKVHFIIKAPGKIKEKQNLSKEFTIFLAYRFGRNNRFLFTTGQTIAAKYWNFDKGRVRNITEATNKDVINNHLMTLEAATEKHISELTSTAQPITAQRLKDFLTSLTSPTDQDTKELTSLNRFLKTFVDQLDKRVNNKSGRLIGYKTKQDYKRTYFYFTEYQRKRGIKLDFNNIDLDFYHDFTTFLQNEASTNKKGEVIKLSTNTIAHKMQSLKAMLNEATEKGLNKYFMYKSSKFRAITEESENIYLSENELKTIENHDFSENQRLEKVRDLFLFGSYTGLRFSDFTRVTNDNITLDGFIRIHQQKTTKPVLIPLLPVARRIWNKYEGKLPKISNQKFNEYIKEVCKKCDIKEPIHKGMTKGGTYISEKYEKWQLIGSHTARRSFATNAYKRGFPAHDIMKITGHRTETAFLKYIKVTQEETAEKIRLLWQDEQRILKIV